LDDIHVMSVPVEKAPDAPAHVEIDFEKGVPVGLDGERTAPVALLERLNKLGGEHGVGTIDIVENRLVGMKSRGVYETPGGTILYKALSALEKLIFDRDTLNYKNTVALKYAQLVYDGLWYTPLREALAAFVDCIQEPVTGTVRVKLYKGAAIPVATKSDNSLYSEEFATFGADEVYDQKDAEGFINLFSLPMKIRAMQKNK
jgi:argininosuccinate synthase